jgi:archaeal flagellin N-terminal-like domain
MASRLRGDEELAVSEVLGVVMLLAMVVTMMGGVFVMLTPYISDIRQ